MSPDNRTAELLHTYANAIAEDLDGLDVALVIAENDASSEGREAIARARDQAAKIRHDLAAMRADAEQCEPPEEEAETVEH